MIYEISDPAIQINQVREIWSKPRIKDVEFDKKMATDSFLKRAKSDRFSRLLRAEQHYTEFMTKLILEQLDQTKSLQKAINNASSESST